jgi:hypothetical protein
VYWQVIRSTQEQAAGIRLIVRIVLNDRAIRKRILNLCDSDAPLKHPLKGVTAEDGFDATHGRLQLIPQQPQIFPYLVFQPPPFGKLLGQFLGQAFHLDLEGFVVL